MRQPPLRVPRSSGTWGSVSSTRTKRYWGTQRVARVCQVSPATVANWIDQGLLKGHKTPTGRRRVEAEDLTALDRKSTRLNSSHGYISYAVFCLKKKKNIKQASTCLTINNNRTENL